MMNVFNKILRKDDYFGIVIVKSNVFSFDGIQKNKTLLTLKIDNLLKPKPLLTQADPFLFVYEDKLYLFYESDRSGEKGIIRMIKTDNLRDWTEPITVLSLSCHLSFPFVFEENGDVYMIPEAQASDSIRLFKGNSDLTKFSFVKTLMFKERTSDVKFNFSDSHLFKQNGVFYLFTSVSYNWTYHLELYYTDDLLNHSFVKHPKSPIYIGNDYGRSGGSILKIGDSCFRISQNCSRSYGGNVSVHKILKISTDDYQEVLYKNDLLEKDGKVYKDGGHQLNIVKFGDDYIYATDYRHHAFCWYESYLRLKRR